MSDIQEKRMSEKEGVLQKMSNDTDTVEGNKN